MRYLKLPTRLATRPPTSASSGVILHPLILPALFFSIAVLASDQLTNRPAGRRYTRQDIAKTGKTPGTPAINGCENYLSIPALYSVGRHLDEFHMPDLRAHLFTHLTQFRLIVQCTWGNNDQ